MLRTCLGSGRHPKVRMGVESCGEAAGTMVPPGLRPCSGRDGGRAIGTGRDQADG
jgi:hypothetical protein